MDAIEEERDIKFYHDLLAPRSRRKESSYDQRLVSDSDTSKLITLLEPFQEWPQLLDPLLPKLVNQPANRLLEDLAAGHQQHQTQSQTNHPGVSQSICAMCRILYTLCKVRGWKVITRFLSNEPQHLEPMLRNIVWNESSTSWEELYIKVLWLSHLVLTPFDLQSISISNLDLFDQLHLPKPLESEKLPNIAKALVFIGLKHLTQSGKQRESASCLLVRIALRPDMQRLGLLDGLIKWVFRELQQYMQSSTASIYQCLGYLSFLLGVLKTGSSHDVLPFLADIFKFSCKCVEARSAEQRMIRKSALSRKALVSILRASSLHALWTISKDNGKSMSEDNTFFMLETTIQCLLDALSDKDTPVRLSASKALSILSEKMNEQMKAEVVQAILDTLEADVFYEGTSTQDAESIALTKGERGEKTIRNLAAVNDLNWQGLMLTLAHLVFRKAVQAVHLPPILNSFLSGLDFEQRSANGMSIGGPVRDAACFGCWSLARKYSTSNLLSIDPKNVSSALDTTITEPPERSVLQIIATNLVVSACLDPSGNIRRGSSAALQELVGRHPDTIFEGIALVQTVDYHAVARRPRATLDVAYGAALLSDTYHLALLNALFGWRGVQSANDDSRRTAAMALSKLVSSRPVLDRWRTLKATHTRIGRIARKNSKTVVESRHGLLMALSRLLDTLDALSIATLEPKDKASVESSLEALWEDVETNRQLLGNSDEKSPPELIIEGLASLIFSLAHVDPNGDLASPQKVVDVLNMCTLRADHPTTLHACASAALGVFRRLKRPQKIDLVHRWLNENDQRHLSFSCKGRILALGSIYQALPESTLGQVFSQLTDFVVGDWPIETQVTALQSLSYAVTYQEAQGFEKPVCAGLDNYKNDQRGDIGSLARLEAIRLASTLIKDVVKRENSISCPAIAQPVLQRIFRLAGEKLDKLRFEAWMCIEGVLSLLEIPTPYSFTHIVDVSTQKYFYSLLRFLQVDWLRPCILQGLVHSMSSGTEDLVRVSRLALLHFVSTDCLNVGPYRILDTLIALLEDSYTDDRQAVPLLEAIAFVTGQQTQLGSEDSDRLPTRRLWNIVRRAHFRSANMRKLEAAVSIYGALAGLQGEMREKTLGKLCDLLLHPYPNIRTTAAAALYIELPSEPLMEPDWSRPIQELRDAAERVRMDISR